jgi:uncharacterized membrane protein YfcA
MASSAGGFARNFQDPSRQASVSAAGLRGMSRERTLKLAAIGTAAGAFSGLFGVGGGSVMVPLLVLWLGYDSRRATATSLAAIIVIASFAAVVQATYGNVNVGDGILIGVPAVGGVLFGTWLQQRIRTREISLLFAALLVATAVELLLK